MTFDSDSKLEALLHGHSYSGHAAGASAGVAALEIFSRPDLNPALLPDGSRLKELWSVDLVTRLSHTPGVKYVVPIGEPRIRTTVLRRVGLCRSAMTLFWDCVTYVVT